MRIGSIGDGMELHKYNNRNSIRIIIWPKASGRIWEQIISGC